MKRVDGNIYHFLYYFYRELGKPGWVSRRDLHSLAYGDHWPTCWATELDQTLSLDCWISWKIHGIHKISCIYFAPCILIPHRGGAAISSQLGRAALFEIPWITTRQGIAPVWHPRLFSLASLHHRRTSSPRFAGQEIPKKCCGGRGHVPVGD